MNHLLIVCPLKSRREYMVDSGESLKNGANGSGLPRAFSSPAMSGAVAFLPILGGSTPSFSVSRLISRKRIRKLGRAEYFHFIL